MITAFQHRRNCLIIGKIFKVMTYTAMSNVGNQEREKGEVKEKEKIIDVS